ncbi:DNRLRE domain-containing protein [Paenibacillus sp.]|uniref:CBM96 family carbohydrate-binding protein n=1 Tax=Paenibacillus sp. TaxID=58172 RepID=UPI0028111EE6|nr:DNRLRE domain-containing protein [Paenibacillus sp.]
MRKRIARRFVASMVALLLFACTVIPAGAAEEMGGAESAVPNLLANGGFEEAGAGGMPAGWSLWTASGTLQTGTAEGVAYEGTKSLRIHADALSRGAVGQTISTGVVGGASYEFGVAVKTEGLRSDDRGATVRVQFYGEGNVNTGNHVMIGSAKGDQDWTPLRQTFQAPTGTVRIQVQLFLWSGTGTAWFDEAVLARTQDPGPGPEEPEEPEDPEAPGLFEVPAGEDIVALLKTRYPGKEHPRIIATEDDFARLRERVESDPLTRIWYLRLKEDVLASFRLPLPTYDIPDGYRLLETSRRVLNDLQHLGIMYQIEKDERYLERAWDILHAAGSFPDWNPQHFLDVSEMTNAFAIGYDWFYDGWTEERKAFLVNAIEEMGLIPAVQVYRGEVQGAFGRSGWINAVNNWNTVVNGGMAMGALAVADESEPLAAIAADVLEGGLRSIQRVLPMFEPDGAGEEGVGYWAYNANYLVYYLSTLDSALGTDYGISELPGIEETSYFPIFMGGPRGTFNYGNNGSNYTQTPSFFWFANRFDDPDVAWYQRSRVGERGGPLDLLWYDPELVGASAQFPLDFRFLKVHSASMRNAWNDDYAAFVGFKGGNNAWNHNHLDLGTFVLDALGVRWATELGSDNYNLPDYFGAGRTAYYRIRTEGQNTLVLQPNAAPGQRVDGKAAIVRAESSPSHAFMIADLTDGYADQATEAKRGIALTDERRHVWVQDEVALRTPGDVYWFMHTTADIDVIENGRAAVLRDGEQRLYAELVAPTDAAFHVRKAEPLPTSPNPEGQATNALNKLTVRAENVGALRLAIRFTPLLPWEEAPTDRPTAIPLAEWAVDPAPKAALAGLTIDGAPLASFRPDTFTYHLPAPEEGAPVPVVGAWAADASDVVEIVPVQTLPGTAVVRVESAVDPASAVEYRIHFVRPASATSDVVTASAHDGNVPLNTIDGNWNTRWSAEGAGQWIQYDLGQARTVDYVDIAFYSGDRRSTRFDILASGDAQQWTTVYSGQSSGTTSGFERFAFEPVDARFVRIVGYGNTSNHWNSITEVYMEGLPDIVKPVRLAELSVGAPSDSISVGQSIRLAVQAFRSDGSAAPIESLALRYATSDPAVATVGSDGLVAGVGPGSAIVSVEAIEDGYAVVGAFRLTVTDGSIRVSPQADAFVRGGSFAAQNYGGATSLTVKRDANADYHREGLMRFDLSAIAGDIESAKLFLYVGVNDTAGTETVLSAYAGDGEWEERTVTWATKPATGERLATAPVNNTVQWVEMDVTSYVAQRRAAGETVQFVLTHAPEHRGLATNIHSRERSGTAPYLRIVEAEAPPEPPTTVASLSPSEPTGLNGWYTEPVTLTLTVEDASAETVTEYRLEGEDAWRPYVQPTTFAADGEYRVQYRSRSDAGGVEDARDLSFALDANAPTVTLNVYGGYASSAVVLPADWVVGIADAGSGAAPESLAMTLDGKSLQTDQPLSLYTLPLGTHRLAVSVADAAGNVAMAEASFTTEASLETLQALTDEFLAQGRIDNVGVANSLHAKIESGQLHALIAELRAQSGKHIAEDAAAILLRDAEALLK